MIRGVAFAGAVLATTAAIAAPKKRDAKVAFQRGVTAYQKGDFAAASEALATSYRLEADVETLFAWAQAERQRDRCDKAIELFGKLLEFDMPAENKKAVQAKIDECKVILAAQKPKEPEPPPVPEKPPEKPPEKVATPPPEEPAPVAAPVTAPVAPAPEGRSPWWKDPIGDALVVGGVVGLAVGGVYLMSGRSAEQESQSNYFLFEDNNQRAERDGKIGVIAAVGGGALLVGGILRYATRGGGGSEKPAVSGWLAPGGGGLAAIGSF